MTDQEKPTFAEREDKGEVTIRPASLRDLRDLETVLTHSLVDRDTKQPIREEIVDVLSAVSGSLERLNDRLYLVAEAPDGQVVGMVGLKTPDHTMTRYATTDNPKEIVNMFVEPAQRGNGIGERLVHGLVALAPHLGATEVVLNSGPRYEEKGHPFWRKMFGEPVAIAKDYYGEGFDAPVWRKALS